jgi:enoyl-CoA hydratase/carnithine racemase
MRAILTATDLAANTGLAAGLEAETCYAWMARESPDGAEGVRSFFDKRTPRFHGLALEPSGPQQHQEDG